MSDSRLILSTFDGTRIWVNMNQIVKMVKDPSSRYYIYLTNGESLEIVYGSAKRVEDFLED